MYRPSCENRTSEMEEMIGTTSPGCDAYVYADRQRVKQILLNLLSNAVKYNRLNGSITVWCTSTDHTLRISVSDTGPGIAAEHLNLPHVSA